MDETEKLIQETLSSIAKAKEKNFIPVLAREHNTLGNLYYDQGKVDEALAEYLIALDYANSTINKGITASINYNIGVLKRYQGKNKEAYEILKQAKTNVEGTFNMGLLKEINLILKEIEETHEKPLGTDGKEKTLNDYHRRFYQLINSKPSREMVISIGKLLEELRRSGLVKRFKKTPFHVPNIMQFDQRILEEIIGEFQRNSDYLNCPKNKGWIEDRIREMGDEVGENKIRYGGVYQEWSRENHKYHLIRFLEDGSVIFANSIVPAIYMAENMHKKGKGIVKGEYSVEGRDIKMRIDLFGRGKMDLAGRICGEDILLNQHNHLSKLFMEQEYKFKHIDFSRFVLESSDQSSDTRANGISDEHDYEHLEMMHDIIKDHIGSKSGVLHETLALPGDTHLDLYVYGPNKGKGRNYWTLITSGMSAKGMNVYGEYKHLEHAELMIKLPLTWNFNAIDSLGEEIFPDFPLPSDALPFLRSGLTNNLSDPNFFWPIKGIKDVARIPFWENSWISFSHSLESDEYPRPFAPNTRMSIWLIKNLSSEDSELSVINIGKRKNIYLYTLVPIYQEEMVFLRKYGLDALVEVFKTNHINDVIDPSRKCMV